MLFILKNIISNLLDVKLCDDKVGLELGVEAGKDNSAHPVLLGEGRAVNTVQKYTCTAP